MKYIWAACAHRFSGRPADAAVARFHTHGHDVRRRAGCVRALVRPSGPRSACRPCAAAGIIEQSACRPRPPTSPSPCHYAHSERWSRSPDTGPSHAPARRSGSRSPP
ncbi:hypothetical protein C6Q14_19690 [Burkholderia ambifaria]|nr:hypothetical protein C6Q14_19690 [Burkholderia ambifaria]